MTSTGVRGADKWPPGCEVLTNGAPPPALGPCRRLLPGNPGMCASRASAAVDDMGNSSTACLLVTGSTAEPGATQDQGGEQSHQQEESLSNTQHAAESDPRVSCPTASMQLPVCSAGMLMERSAAAASLGRGHWAWWLLSALGCLALLVAAAATLTRLMGPGLRRLLEVGLPVGREGVQLLQQTRAMPALHMELSQRMALLKQQGRILHTHASQPHAFSGDRGCSSPRAHESMRQATSTGPLRQRLSDLTFVEDRECGGVDDTAFVLLGTGTSSKVCRLPCASPPGPLCVLAVAQAYCCAGMWHAPAVRACMPVSAIPCA